MSGCDIEDLPPRAKRIRNNPWETQARVCLDIEEDLLDEARDWDRVAQFQMAQRCRDLAAAHRRVAISSMACAHPLAWWRRSLDRL